ncbi:MAG TPA: hypothetical protein VIJ21_10125 [Solirubrobacterales bacterium]
MVADEAEARAREPRVVGDHLDDDRLRPGERVLLAPCRRPLFQQHPLQVFVRAAADLLALPGFRLRRFLTRLLLRFAFLLALVFTLRLGLGLGILALLDFLLAALDRALDQVLGEREVDEVGAVVAVLLRLVLDQAAVGAGRVDLRFAERDLGVLLCPGRDDVDGRARSWCLASSLMTSLSQHPRTSIIVGLPWRSAAPASESRSPSAGKTASR